MENTGQTSGLREQIQALKELTAEQIRNARDGCSHELKALSDRLKILEDTAAKLDSELNNHYVSREFLSQSLNLINEKYIGEINKVYAKFDPIRSILYFIATTIGGVFLVALAGFVLKGFSQGFSG